MTLYKNKYLIETNRLKGYDYSSNRGYFITICTKDRINYFGKIVNGNMELNDLGKIVEKQILNTSIIRKNIIVDSYIIMPNHLHMIIFILNNVETHCNASRDRCNLSLQNENKFGPQYNNLGSIIRGLKGSVKKTISEYLGNSKSFSRQSNYHDHIIRNKSDLNNIREYIINNPLKWEIDNYYKSDLIN